MLLSGFQFVLQLRLGLLNRSQFGFQLATPLAKFAYLLLGAGFGLTPEMSLALSLLKRGRDLTLGLPTIAVWQFIEGRRLLRRRRPAPPPGAEVLPPGD